MHTSTRSPSDTGPLIIVENSGPLRVHADLGGVTGIRYAGRALARDVQDDATARAALLAKSGAILCMEGAAWVYGGVDAGPFPPEAEHAAPPGQRDDSLPRALRLAPGDVAWLGATALTTPMRTALDIGRLLPRDRAVYWLLVLAQAGAPLTDWARYARRRRRGGFWAQAAQALEQAADFYADARGGRGPGVGHSMIITNRRRLTPPMLASGPSP